MSIWQLTILAIFFPKMNGGTKILDITEGKINGHPNETLIHDFSDEEISNSLFQIVPLQGQGPNGVPARFF